MKTILKISPLIIIVMGLAGCGGKVGANNGRSITLINNTSNSPLTVYMGFNGQSFGCYSQSYFSKYCSFTGTGNAYVCQMTVQKGTPVSISFTRACQVSFALTPTRAPWGACPTSLAEFTLNGVGGDTVDVSLVNGINKKIDISSTSSGSIIKMSGASSPYNNIKGVFPPGCDACALSISPPTWPGCPGQQPKGNCQAGTQYNPNPGCQITRVPVNSADSYDVTFSNQ